MATYKPYKMSTNKLSCTYNYCKVPGCKSQYGDGTSIHKIPRKVMENKEELKKWSDALKMGKGFPNKFTICSRHFKKKDLLVCNPGPRGSKRVLLTNRALPCRKLPRSPSILKKTVAAKERAKMKMQSCKLDPFDKINIDSAAILEEKTSSLSDEVQIVIDPPSKIIQINNEPEKLNDLPFQINTNRNLYIMTGIRTNQVLESLVNVCLIIRNDERYKNAMSLRNRIVLTMFRLRTNVTNLQVANLFQLSHKTAANYFSDCVQLLAKALKPCIYWQTQEENKANLPKYLEQFGNPMTVLDCTDIKTITHRCLKCSTCTYSYYKGAHTVNILIGIAPSGLVNFLSTTVAGDKPVMNLKNLLEMLKPGDAVMVDKGFHKGNELLRAGVEMIRPNCMPVGISKEDIERDRLIAAARVHIDRKIARLKIFKILSEKMSPSILPYIDDICTIICAVSNLSSPFFDKNKFIIKIN